MISLLKANQIEEIFRENIYFYADYKLNRGWCGITRMCKTWALIVGIGEDGYAFRYCYEDFDECMLDLMFWDGKNDPIGPWIKKKGKGFDDLNPTFGNYISSKERIDLLADHQVIFMIFQDTFLNMMQNRLNKLYKHEYNK